MHRGADTFGGLDADKAAEPVHHLADSDDRRADRRNRIKDLLKGGLGKTRAVLAKSEPHIIARRRAGAFYSEICVNPEIPSADHDTASRVQIRGGRAGQIDDRCRDRHLIGMARPQYRRQ